MKKPYKNGILASMFFLMCSIFCFSQKQANIWYFGNNAGIDFNSGSPIALLDGQTNALEGTSAISDSAGSLLFYSDGMTVWNKNHQIMLNGTNLLGNTSTTQSSIVVPDPTNPNRYFYLFTVSSGYGGGDISDGLRYSKVDICLDSSRGGIIPTEKNIKIVDTVAEKIAVTRQANGIDYWILTHKFYSNEFWALRLTASGIVDTVISKIGSSHSGNISDSQGQLKFSNNGQKIAIAAKAASSVLNLLELFDFDKTTGIVSNFQPLNRKNNGAVYGVEFSSDGSKLYSVSSSFSPFGMDISQYDLNAGNLTAINASLNSVYNETSIVKAKGLQIGTNGRIYMVSLSNAFTLASINSPNTYSVGCNFQDQSVSLSGKRGEYTLPSFIAGFDYSNGLIQCNQTGISENSINKNWLVYPNPAQQYFVVELPKGQNFNLQVFDVTGRAIYENKNATGTVKVDCSNLGSGMYFVKAVNQRTILTGKIVKE